MKKKLLTCIFAVTISAMMLTGCGDNANTVKEPTTTQTPTSTLAPTQPEVTEVPETTDVPEVTETPEVTEVPETTEVPEATPEVTPEVTETTSDTENTTTFDIAISDIEAYAMTSAPTHKLSELDTSKFDFVRSASEEFYACNILTGSVDIISGVPEIYIDKRLASIGSVHSVSRDQRNNTHVFYNDVEIHAADSYSLVCTLFNRLPDEVYMVNDYIGAYWVFEDSYFMYYVSTYVSEYEIDDVWGIKFVSGTFTSNY